LHVGRERIEECIFMEGRKGLNQNKEPKFSREGVEANRKEIKGRRGGEKALSLKKENEKRLGPFTPSRQLARDGRT